MASSKRGFASMDQAKQREIASKGGRAAHAKGTAHEFTSDEARVAGRKGGEAVSRDRDHMAAIGREGGHSRGARARAASSNPSTTPSSGNVDIPQGSGGSQPFVREANENRGTFEPTNRNSFGTQERNGTSRDERSGDNSNNGSAFSGRDRI
jgi:general stress protein YciG